MGDTIVTGSKLTALANSIRTKGGTSASLTLDQMKTAVDNFNGITPSGTYPITQNGEYTIANYEKVNVNVPSGSGSTDTETLIKLIERSANSTSITIPNGATKIGAYAFYNFTNLSSVSIPSNITAIEEYAFSRSGLTSIDIPNSVITIESNAFDTCSNLTTATINSSSTGDAMFLSCSNLLSIHLGSNVTRIADRLVAGCPRLTSLYIPNSITTVVSYDFGIAYNCPNLEYVTIQNGFNANKFNLSASGSTKFSVETIVSWLNALADRTGQTTYTLTIGTTNVNKLTAEQIAIATNKNWNLA